jgi:hypothetical protein
MRVTHRKPARPWEFQVVSCTFFEVVRKVPIRPHLALFVSRCAS